MADTPNTSGAGALAFRDTTFNVIERDGQPWLTAADIARALGYSREDSISRLYRANADEFTEQMTMVVSGNTDSVFPGNPLSIPTRIFSLRGAHLIGMFARTPLAAEFRRWVLDALEQHTRAPATLTPGAHLLDARRRFAQLAEKLPEDLYREALHDATLQQMADGYLAYALGGRRWLVSFDRMGTMLINPVPQDAGVMTFDDVVRDIESGEMVRMADVLRMAEACHSRIKRRLTSPSAAGIVRHTLEG